MATPTNPTAWAVLQQEFIRIMSPPRRPRGEKPRTTIRIMQTQIRSMSSIIADLRSEIAAQKTTIARMDVETSELNDHLDSSRRRVDGLEHAAKGADGIIRAMSDRLSFLEGYYAKSIEILPNDPAKAIAGAGPGDTRALQTRAQTQEGRGQKDFESRPNVGLGGQIRGFPQNNPTPAYRRPVESAEIEWSEARDGPRPRFGTQR